MTETAADEQDLAKALDSVASAASSLDGSSSVQSDGSMNNTIGAELPPIVLPNSPVAPIAPPPAIPAAEPTYPPIIPAHDSSDRPGSDQFSVPTPLATPSPAPADVDSNTPSDDSPSTDSTDTVDTTNMSASAPLNPDAPAIDGPLADIKKSALDELRPLVDKLDVDPQEKFDTYLLLIRSTDDSSLVGPAHEAAKSISDEAKRAEALLEIVKEIDYLSRK